MALNVELIRESFEQAKPIANQVADKFYEFLWQDYPASKALFENVVMDQQKKALIGSLVYIVDHLEDGEALVAYLKKMGARHVAYGAEPEHYEWVGASLLKTFAHFFGDAWTDELESNWTEAYQFIAGQMIEGASEAPSSADMIVDRAREIANSLVHKLVAESVDDQFIEQVRHEVRKVMFQVLEEESKTLLKKKTA